MVEKTIKRNIEDAIRRLDSQIRTLEDYKRKQKDEYEIKMSGLKRNIEILKAQQEKAERAAEDRIIAVKKQKLDLEKKSV